MIDEFRPRFFDLGDFTPKEVELTYGEADAFDWGGYRHLTRVRWDPQCAFVIEVGNYCHQIAIEELQKQMAAEYTPVTVSEMRNDWRGNRL